MKKSQPLDEVTQMFLSSMPEQSPLLILSARQIADEINKLLNLCDTQFSMHDAPEVKNHVRRELIKFVRAAGAQQPQ